MGVLILKGIAVSAFVVYMIYYIIKNRNNHRRNKNGNHR